MATLIEVLDTLLAIKPAVMAIDGPCGGGKSTLAKRLQAHYEDALVLHMDDFFLPPALRTPARLKQPGENVHHERFLTEALLPALKGQPFTYHRFDCKTGELHPILAQPARLTIVEGSYSLHPALRPYYDLKVFLDVDEDTQAMRILTRNGPEQAAPFFQKWIPMENAYFAQQNLRQVADLVLGSS